MDSSTIQMKLLHDKALKISDEKYVKHEYSFELLGVTNDIVAGLRRTSMLELKVSALHCEYEHIETDDVRIIPNVVTDRIRLIPVHQSCPVDAVFSLDVYNNTTEIMDVLTEHFKIKRKGTMKGTTLEELPFENNHVLCTLEPAHYMIIRNIVVRRDYGYVHAAHAVAFQGTALMKEDIIVNAYDNKTGAHISNTTLLDWIVTFRTNGTMGPKDIMLKTCKSLIKRLINIKSYTQNVSTVENVSKLVILNETHTMRNLILRGATNILPHIKAITGNVDYINRTCTISMNDVQNVEDMFDKLIANRVAVLQHIHDVIAKW